MTFFPSCGAAVQAGVVASSFLRFLDHTQRRTTVGRTPLDEWSVRCRDLYWLHKTVTTDSHPCSGGIPTRNSNKRTPTGIRLRPLGRWDRHLWSIFLMKCFFWVTKSRRI